MVLSVQFIFPVYWEFGRLRCGGVRLATLREMGDRFVSACKRAEVGKVFEERHVTFFTSEELSAAFTPKRRELLRRLHGKARKPVAMFKKRNAC